MLIKLLKITIALSMLIISLTTWRYQGDIHHMHKRVFKTERNYSQDLHKRLWNQYAKKSQKIEMKKISFYAFIQKREEHPSEAIMNSLIESKEWKKFIPNSNSSTYKLSQKIWMSQNLSIQELINYALKVKTTSLQP